MKIHDNVAIINQEYGIFCTYDGNFFDYEGNLIHTCNCIFTNKEYNGETTKWVTSLCYHLDNVCKCNDKISSERHRNVSGIKWYIYYNYTKYTLKCSRRTLVRSLNVYCNTLARCSIKTFPELICVYPKDKHINMKMVNLLYMHTACKYILMVLDYIGIVKDIRFYIMKRLNGTQFYNI